jgi:glycine dehydrogenase subunit 2
MLIFEQSREGRRAQAQAPHQATETPDIPAEMLREEPPLLPAASEMQVVRHYTRLSQKNFSIDTQFYPLGSCTMKYNPRACNKLAMLPGFLARHPLAPVSMGQGFLACMYDGDSARNEILVPDAAHGTNPATAVMCGYKVHEIPTDRNGDVDMEALRGAVGPHTAGIMLTNPSTLGVFERRIEEIAGIIHEAGGLLYYDGANLNAILGKVRPGDMGFDVIHMNLHKTFSTPHGGGGPGAGPVGVSKRLEPFLPVPVVGYDGDEYYWITEDVRPQSIGRLSAFMGNAGVLMRAYIYARMLGSEGMHRVADYATLNANYLMARLTEGGFDVAFPGRRATHEFIVTLKRQQKELGITAMDFAKRLLDYNFHAPTTYFPLLVPECLLIEPTETETKEELDGFVDAMISIQQEAENSPELLKEAPHTQPVRRLDEVRAAKQLDLAWHPAEG